MIFTGLQDTKPPPPKKKDLIFQQPTESFIFTENQAEADTTDVEPEMKPKNQEDSPTMWDYCDLGHGRGQWARW